MRGGRRGEEKEPLLLLHIQKETTGSISINHTPLQFALLNLEATSSHFQMHVETGYIPIPSQRNKKSWMVFFSLASAESPRNTSKKQSK